MTCSVRDISEYVNSSGTGRWSDWTSDVSAFVRLVISFWKNVVSPMVADMRRKRDWGSVRRGICHAMPRSVSE